MSVINVLKPHNAEAFQEICEKIESGITRLAAPRATGSGKTYLMGALAEKYNDEKKLVLEPTRPLLNSIKDKFDEFGIKNTDFITYQKLIRMSDEDITAMDYKLIFLDECHHGTAPVWGSKIECLMTTHLDSIVFGTSATTVRNDGTNVVENLFNGNAIGELPLSTAIARKVLPCPHYITAIYRLDDELDKLKKKVGNSTNTKGEKKEFLKKIHMMKTQLDKSYGIPLILNKYIKVRNGRYLVFCKNRKQLNTMRDVVIDWFRVAGIKDIHSYAVYSDYPDKEKDYKDFQEDNSDSAKILFSINMLNEGCHIQGISGVLMLRTTQSILVYLQQLGRLVEAGNMDEYLLVFDFVNNFSSVNDGIGLLKEIKYAVAKEKESNPDFDDSGFEDIDTFFVIDQVVEIQEMFRKIEGRLKGREWTEEENNILREHYPVEGSEVADRLEGRTKAAIMEQARRLGISSKYANCTKWTDEENEILKKYYLVEKSKVANRLKGRTKVAVKSQAKKLGLTVPKTGRKWTKEENELLKEYYPIEGYKVMKRLKGRTKKAVQAQLVKLGLVHKSTNNNKSTNNKYKYVYKNLDKYTVTFRVDGKLKSFGRFDSEEEAAKVALQKAKEYGKTI